MRSAVITCLFFCVVCGIGGCATIDRDQPLVRVKQLLDSRFTYASNEAKWGKEFYWQPGETGEKPFTGNCVNYADAAVYQLKKYGIPAQQWLVKTEGDEFHMVTCAKGWCIDNRRHWPFPQKDFSYQWVVNATVR